MRFKGTGGDDDYSGTAHRDKFDMSQGGNDTVFGQGGKDLFYFGAAFTADDSIDGGVRTVHHKIKVLGTVELAGDYSAGVVFGAQTMTNIAHLVLDGGFSYNLTFNQTTVAAGREMIVDALALGAGNSLVVDASADSDGYFTFKTNAAHVDLTGGGKGDSFFLGATLDPTDHIDGGPANDTWLYLRGDYNSTMVLDASWISHIEHIQLGIGHYSFVATDTFNQNVVDVTGGDGGEVVANFDASAETANIYVFRNLTGAEKGGAGDDTLDHITGAAFGNDGNDHLSVVTGTADGGNGNDVFYDVHGTSLGGAGNDSFASSGGTIDAGTGDDTVINCSGDIHLEHTGIVHFDNSDSDVPIDATLYFGASYAGTDFLFGGDGIETVVLDGDYSHLTTLGVNLDKFVLVGGHSYDLATREGAEGSVTQIEIDARDLGAGDSLTFNGVSVRGIDFVINGGDGNDHITASSHNDLINGGGGDDILDGDGPGNRRADVLRGGLGADTLIGHGGKEVFV